MHRRDANLGFLAVGVFAEGERLPAMPVAADGLWRDTFVYRDDFRLFPGSAADGRP